MILEKTKSIFSNYSKEKFLLGLSGGVDSISMAYTLKSLSIDFIAVIVNHNLRSESLFESEFTQKFCIQNQIDFEYVEWDGVVDKNLEEEAREFRYQTFIEIAQKRKIKHILTAHHLNDQIETFFMNLNRGSGVMGLSCMQFTRQLESGILLMRPWLDIPKEDIVNYAKKNGLKWVEDKSNLDTNFTRNKIRMFLNQNKGILNFSRINQSIQNIQNANATLKKSYDYFITKHVVFHENEIIFPKDFFLSLLIDEKRSVLSILIKQLSKKRHVRLQNINNILKNLESDDIKKMSIANLFIKNKNNDIIMSKNSKI